MNKTCVKYASCEHETILWDGKSKKKFAWKIVYDCSGRRGDFILFSLLHYTTLVSVGAQNVCSSVKENSALFADCPGGLSVQTWKYFEGVEMMITGRGTDKKLIPVFCEMKGVSTLDSLREMGIILLLKWQCCQMHNTVNKMWQIICWGICKVWCSVYTVDWCYFACSEGHLLRSGRWCGRAVCKVIACLLIK